jgi:glycosyltransferase involved in cell wall biosynthesis
VGVSVVIPAYEQAMYLSAAIESVLGQTERELELLVVDDGSTDDSAVIVEKYAQLDSRVRLLRQENRGAAAARNHGIREAREEFVAFLDGDDVWVPQKLERQLREFARVEKDVVGVGCLMEYVSTRGKILGVSGESTEKRSAEIAKGKFMPFGAASVLVAPTELVRELGGFDEELRYASDFDLVAKLARCGRLITVPEVLARYLIHSESESATNFFDQRAVMRFVGMRAEARERGQELAWEFRRQSSPTLWERRGDYCAYYYRTAGLRFADGRVLSGALYLAASGLLGPRYVVTRFLRQRGLAHVRRS